MQTKGEIKEHNNRYLEKAIEQGWTINNNKTHKAATWLHFGESPTNVEFVMVIPNVEPIFKKNPNEMNKWLAKEANGFDIIYIWGKDGLQISTPSLEEFTFEECTRRLNVCLECKEQVEKVERVGFAGRYCPTCAEKLRPELEYEGWTE